MAITEDTKLKKLQRENEILRARECSRKFADNTLQGIAESFRQGDKLYASMSETSSHLEGEIRIKWWRPEDESI